MNKKSLHKSGRAIGALAVFFCAVWFTGCRPETQPGTPKQPPKMEKPPVVVGEVRAQLIEKSVTLPATVESDEEALLMAKVEAYVKDVLVDIGDEVEAGQVLVRLEAPELEHKAEEQQQLIQHLRADGEVLQAELAAAETELHTYRAKLALEQSERGRLERLVSSGAINRQRLEEAEFELKSAAASLARHENSVRVAEARLEKGQAQLQVAHAQFQQARSMVDYLEIKAPFAGVIAARNVDPGALVQPGGSGKPLLTVAKVDRLRAVLFATMDTTAQLAIGNPVTYKPDDVPGQTFTGTVSRMAGTYNEKTRMMRAEVDLANEPDPNTGQRPLRAGSYGNAVIVTHSATMPVVPQTALRRQANGTSVVVVRDDTCLVTPVKVALENDGLVGIASGVVAGDWVVLKDASSISNEQKLSPSEIKRETW